MATRGARNNLLAGIFVLGSIILATAVIIVLSDLDQRLTPMTDFVVRFSLNDGAEGLRPGSQVKVGGQPVGRVLGWTFALNDAGEPTAVDVQVSVRSDINIYEDATILLVMPLLGSTSQINIPDVGGRNLSPDQVQGSTPLIEEGDIVQGRLAAPGFLAQAGYGEEQRQQVQEILKNMAAASERVFSITERVDAELEPVIAEMRTILADARAVAGDVRERWPGWREQIDASISSFTTANQRMNSVVESVQAGVEEARAMIAENRPRISAATRNIEELSTKANTEGWEMVRAMLDRGMQGMDEFAAAAERVEGLISETDPELRTLVANARLASDQLKLTAAEVRAAPWKLLSRPTGRRELENEVLYDAARQYAQAVSDLRAASESLESVAAASRASGRTALEQEQIDRLVHSLQDAFARYQQAEREFLNRLMGPPRR